MRQLCYLLENISFIPLIVFEDDFGQTGAAPGVTVVPLAITAGPGTTYLLTAEWILIKIPGSLALYAPGKLTVAGVTLPPPVTVNWSTTC
jgi:hypothetical protein